jgi:hypothetical protein
VSRQIAIVGLSPSTHEDAPWGDDKFPWSDDKWEIWGLPWDSMWQMIDVHFEMHALELLKDSTILPPRYFDRLRSSKNLYMQQEYEEIPNAKAYPLEEVKDKCGDYFNSSISYMLAYAIRLRVRKIGIWGVDMDDIEALDPNDPSYKTEYKYQRPNLEYLIGFARGLGIEVYIPEQSSLCKFNGEGVPFGPLFPNYPQRYGFLT